MFHKGLVPEETKKECTDEEDSGIYHDKFYTVFGFFGDCKFSNHL